MGRLQRKKTAKKKKKSAYSADAPAAAAGGTALKPVSVQSKAAREKKGVAARKPSVARSVPTKPKDNFLSKAVQFLREVKVELKKVAWPTRKQTLGSTLVVIILVMVIAFFLGAVDIGLSSLVKVVLQ